MPRYLLPGHIKYYLNRPFPSAPVPLFQNESKCETYENEFCMPFHFHGNQSHFHKNGFALGLALKQRHKGTRKWPILKTFRHFKTQRQKLCNDDVNRASVL